MIAAVRTLFGKGKKTEPEPRLWQRDRLEIAADDTVVYAIGDVHGCLRELLAAEERIVADAATLAVKRRIILLLGDLIDRGPQSADVLDHVTGPSPRGFERMALCGNHDDTLLAFIDDPGANEGWLEFGGVETMRSYGMDVERLLRQRKGLANLGSVLRETVPERHIAYLSALPVSVRFGNTLFVHAGVRPGVALDDQEDEDFMWIREPFMSVDHGLGLTVVHGHTPAKDPVFVPGRIGIDTGAYATGRLTVLRIFHNEAAIID